MTKSCGVIVEDSSANMYIEKCESFKATQELVRAISNLLVGNMYWLVAFKILVFDGSLFEETSNRSNSKIWKSFLS